MDVALAIVDKAVWPWRTAAVWAVQWYFRLWKYGLLLIGGAVMLPFEIVAAARREQQTRARLLIVEKQAEIAAAQALDLEKKLEASQRERRRCREKLEECLADRRRLRDRVRELQTRTERLEREKRVVEIEAASIKERTARAELEVAAAARIVGQRAVEGALAGGSSSQQPSDQRPSTSAQRAASSAPAGPSTSKQSQTTGLEPPSEVEAPHHVEAAWTVYFRWVLSCVVACGLVWWLLSALKTPQHVIGGVWAVMVLPTLLAGGRRGWVGEATQGAKWFTAGFAVCYYLAQTEFLPVSACLTEAECLERLPCISDAKLQEERLPGISVAKPQVETPG